ncbi:MAG: hypothetical protein ACTSWN_10825 [Promethearchaeota archaeon]
MYARLSGKSERELLAFATEVAARTLQNAGGQL